MTGQRCAPRRSWGTLAALACAALVALAGCARVKIEPGGTIVMPVGSTEQLPATLFKPDGPGPFPAIVIMHDCSGLGPRSSGAPRRWARELLALGYVVIIPDSFAPRGFVNGVCTTPAAQSQKVSGYARAADAYGALAHLRTLSYVDRKHVGLIGGSHGGWATLAAIVEPSDDTPLARAKRDGFAAAVALYPVCGARFGEWRARRGNRGVGPVVDYEGAYAPTAPLLILIGEKDDWTQAEDCRRLAEASRAAGYPVDIKIYPEALHSFESDAPLRFVAERDNIDAPGARGASTGGDAAAWADAKRQIAAFFAQNLNLAP